MRPEPDLREEALVIVEGNGSHVHVVAATRRARKKAIRPGMSLTQARSIMPKLIARNRDTACEQTAQEVLLEVAETFSPRLEDAGDGIVFVDVTGMERHFLEDGENVAGSPAPRSPEERLARAAIRAMEAAALPGRARIAPRKLPARLAAHLPKPPVTLPP